MLTKGSSLDLLLFRHLRVDTFKTKSLPLDLTYRIPDLKQDQARLRACLLNMDNRANTSNVNFKRNKEREVPANAPPHLPAPSIEKTGPSEVPITQILMVATKLVAIQRLKRGTFRPGIDRKTTILVRAHKATTIQPYAKVSAAQSSTGERLTKTAPMIKTAMRPIGSFN